MKVGIPCVLVILLLVSGIATFLFVNNTETKSEISSTVQENIQSDIDEQYGSGDMIQNEIDQNEYVSGETNQTRNNDLPSNITTPSTKNTTNTTSSIQKSENKTVQSNSNSQQTNETIPQQENTEKVANSVVIPSESVGVLQIPKISLNQAVLEGHSLDVLKNGLGHVLETAYWQGNVGILGHNGGNAGYFKDLTKLVIGDTISYTTEHGTRNYKVTEIVQIDDIDWSYLANTKDNRITLITCVKNVPTKRLCVQATEII